MRFMPFLLAAMIATSSLALAADWQADPAQSTLSFTGTAEGMDFDGHFGDFTPAIRFDPADLAGARFDVRISLASADTANSDRDETMKGSDFFAIKRFPEASYTATSFRDLGEGRYAADGTLSLRGVEKPVTLEFSWVTEGDAAILDGSASLNRLDFEVGGGDWSDASTIAHEVKVRTHLQLKAN